MLKFKLKNKCVMFRFGFNISRICAWRVISQFMFDNLEILKQANCFQHVFENVVRIHHFIGTFGFV